MNRKKPIIKDRASSNKNEKSEKRYRDRKFQPGFMKQYRLIVRNLPFSCTEDDLRSTFSKFGVIQEIVLPPSKKYPNSCAGFAFVQFRTEDSAKEAMKEVNETEIKGRPIAVDWAVPKDQYMTAVLEGKEREILETKAKDVLSPRGKVKRRKERNQKNASTTSDDESSRDEDHTPIVSPRKKKKRNEKDREPMDIETAEPDDDVHEGRTIFVRNIPFDIPDGELKEAFAEFGQLKYCVICRYPGTDQSKGSGFVQFVEKEDAEKCLEIGCDQASDGIMVRGQKVIVCRAISKESARQMEKEKHTKEPKDKRNLHLLRVGLIRAGTVEAAGASERDMAIRMRIEAANRAKIKDFNIFISPTRICIHNIPATLDDKELKTICLKAVMDKAARIKECRIMRDLHRVNSVGTGKSRGYAFVEFSEHEHAMECLKNLNNNPEIFSNEKRPIVEFSLENRRALLIKAQRIEKAKMKSAEMKQQQEPESNVKENNKRKLMKGMKKQKLVVPTVARQSGDAKKGGTKQKAFPSHFGPKIRHRKRLPPKPAGQGGSPGKKSKKEKGDGGQQKALDRVSHSDGTIKKKRSGKKKTDEEPGTRKRWFNS